MTHTTAETTTYQVNGMTCGHCVQAITAEIDALTGVETVTVDLATGAVSVTCSHPLARADIAAAVREAGYQLA